MFQAVFTFFYIHLLSQVGERVAADMKQDLFQSILDQDMSFFDQERTGELVNRYECFQRLMKHLIFGEKWRKCHLVLQHDIPTYWYMDKINYILLA